MRDRTIKALQNMAGTANKQQAEWLIGAMQGALIDFQQDSDFTVTDWDNVTYRGHDMSEEWLDVHYLEVDTLEGTYTVEFEIDTDGIGTMLDFWDTY